MVKVDNSFLTNLMNNLPIGTPVYYLPSTMSEALKLDLADLGVDIRMLTYRRTYIVKKQFKRNNIPCYRCYYKRQSDHWDYYTYSINTITLGTKENVIRNGERLIQ